MKRMAICLVPFVMLIVGVTPEVQARDYFTFINHCNIPIQISFHVPFWCKDHHSGPIPPGGIWQCNSNCHNVTLKIYALTPSGKKKIGECDNISAASCKPWAVFGQTQRIRVDVGGCGYYVGCSWTCQ